MSKKYMEYENLVYYDTKIKEYIGNLPTGVTKQYVDNQDTEINNKIGNLSNLGTNDKSNIVNAFNEVFQNVDNGKDLIASAITDKGVTTSKNATFETMANNISSIITGGGDLTPIHKAIENLGNKFSDLANADGEEVSKILSKWFMLKPYSDKAEPLLDVANGTLNNWMMEDGLTDFGDYINPNCIAKAISVTENLNTGLYISEEVADIKLTKIYQGVV